jgi:hydroxymethylbilane synthase
MASPRPITIGTRGSKLALVQTDLARKALLAAYSAWSISVQEITTKGDVMRDVPLGFIDDRAMFVGEIEEALLRGKIDLAVHSTKDIPSEVPEGLVIAAYLPRANPFDALLSLTDRPLHELPQGARVGTSSLRRAAQLRAARPDLEIADLRGNVDTRMRKLFELHQYDAAILAVAGLERLGETARITQIFDEDTMLPAAGQGAIALEVRANDQEMLDLLAAVSDPATQLAVTTERAFQKAVGAGCHAAVAAYATVSGHKLRLRGMIAAIDGRTVRDSVEGRAQEGEAMAQRLAAHLLAGGGAALLEALPE